MTTEIEQKPGGCLATILNLFRSSPPRAAHQETISKEAPQAYFPEITTPAFPREDLHQTNSAESIGPLPYRLRSDFLSPAELSFYHVLSSIVGDRATISTKVRLADLFFVPQSQERQAYQNKIDRKHLDFLLCDPKTMRPLVGLELDDKSHERQDRVERDAFVAEVFEVAGIPLVRIPNQRTYSQREIAAYVMPVLEGEATAPTQSAMPVPMTAVPPTCPNCNIPMVIRMSTRGQNQGKQFYGCSNYPQCRSTIPIV